MPGSAHPNRQQGIPMPGSNCHIIDLPGILAGHPANELRADIQNILKHVMIISIITRLK